MNYYIGVDPGWTNLGYAIISEDLSTILTGSFSPKDLRPGSAPEEILGHLEDRGVDMECDVRFGAMERFVYYKGVHNPDSERILMVTGQLQYMFHQGRVPVKLLRAADWKNFLVKHLVKRYKFNNPSTRLDKQFSMAAAKCIAGNRYKFPNDHEADAFCLAYMAKLSHQVNSKR